MLNIGKLESQLWETVDPMKAGSRLTPNQYCILPVLELIFFL